eukprot:COSAG02_NODE_30709_length_546_cov_1.310962_1_plen_40_part_01
MDPVAAPLPGARSHTLIKEPMHVLRPKSSRAEELLSLPVG